MGLEGTRGRLGAKGGGRGERHRQASQSEAINSDEDRRGQPQGEQLAEAETDGPDSSGWTAKGQWEKGRKPTAADMRKNFPTGNVFQNAASRCRRWVTEGVLLGEVGEADAPLRMGKFRNNWRPALDCYRIKC